jgi:hypothetical protein
MEAKSTVPSDDGQERNQEVSSLVKLLIKLSSTKENPTVPPYLPEPIFVPFGYVTIEKAICLIGRAIYGEAWSDDDVRDGRKTNEEWLHWAEEFEARQSISDRLKEYIPVVLGMAPQRQARWKGAVDFLLALLHDEATHAMYVDESTGKKIGLVTSWATLVARRVIENGTATVSLSDGSVAEVRPMICLPSLELALAGIELGGSGQQEPLPIEEAGKTSDQAAGRKRGPAPYDDTEHFQKMDRVLKSEKARSYQAAATMVVDDGEVEGASREAKIERLRKGYSNYVKRTKKSH